MTLSDCLTDLPAPHSPRARPVEEHLQGLPAQLRHVHRWLTENGYPEPTTDCLNVPVCRRVLYYLSGKGLRPRSILSYFDPLDGLCAFLVEHGLLNENPVKRLTLPKKDAAVRKTVSDEEVRGHINRNGAMTPWPIPSGAASTGSASRRDVSIEVVYSTHHYPVGIPCAPRSIRVGPLSGVIACITVLNPHFLRRRRVPQTVRSFCDP